MGRVKLLKFREKRERKRGRKGERKREREGEREEMKLKIRGKIQVEFSEGTLGKFFDSIPIGIQEFFQLKIF